MSGERTTQRTYEARDGSPPRRGAPALDLFLAGAALALLALSGGTPVASVVAFAACMLAALNTSVALRRTYGPGEPRLSEPLASVLRALLATAIVAWSAALLSQSVAAPVHLADLGTITLWGWLLALGLLARAALAGPARHPVRRIPADHRQRLSVEPPPRVSVVIPALNEAENLRHVLPRLPEGLHEVILVDGHSTDGTAQVALEELPSIRVVTQSGRGKGDAFQAGFAAVTGDIIVMLDADGSADPDEIPRFVDSLVGGADFAKGSRYVPGGGSADMTRIRQLGNWALSRTANLLYGTDYTDLCYGYNAFWVQCLPYISVDVPGFEVETLVNVRIAKAGLRVEEVPSFEAERIHGESHLNTFRDGFRVLRTMMRELPAFAGSERPVTAGVGRRAGQSAQEPAHEPLASGR
jgi:Glycosyl transferase family 2